MIQIKFREWDPEREKMYGKGHGMSYSNRLESDNATMFVFDHEESDDNREEEKDVNGVPFRRLMQYTGLHDKSGREIYECDIVKMHQVVLSPDDKIGWVEYTAQYGYSIRFCNRRCRQSDWANDEGAKYEVIGNVYENPELMEVAEHDAD